MKDLLLSTPTNTYWNGKGANQQEFIRLSNKFMETSGSSQTLNGEVIRAINRLYYEFCNNGNCNAVEEDVNSFFNNTMITSFYQNFIDLIREFFKIKDCKNGIELINEIENIIETLDIPDVNNIHKYDKCIDYIVWLVLNDEDNSQSLPTWYENI